MSEAYNFFLFGTKYVPPVLSSAINRKHCCELGLVNHLRSKAKIYLCTYIYVCDTSTSLETNDQLFIFTVIFSCKRYLYSSMFMK